MEKLFASTCRVRILKALSRKGETNIMDLVHQTNSTWLEIDRNIRLLKKMEIVDTRFCQNRRLIKLNKKEDRVEVVLKALRMLEKANFDQLLL